MRFFSIIAYIISSILFLIPAWSLFNPFSYWEPSAILFIIAGFTIGIVNFKFSEITRAVKNAVSSGISSYENLISDKNVLNTIWKYLLSVSVVLIISVLVMMLANLNDTAKLGPSLALMSILPLYVFIIKFFILMPLEISLEKKIIVLKSQK